MRALLTAFILLGCTVVPVRADVITFTMTGFVTGDPFPETDLLHLFHTTVTPGTPFSCTLSYNLDAMDTDPSPQIGHYSPDGVFTVTIADSSHQFLLYTLDVGLNLPGRGTADRFSFATWPIGSLGLDYGIVAFGGFVGDDILATDALPTERDLAAFRRAQIAGIDVLSLSSPHDQLQLQLTTETVNAARSANPVPEPSSLVLLGSALLGTKCVRRWRRRRASRN